MALLNPYLNFADGNTREAMEFYASVFGGEVTYSTFGEIEMPGVGADEADLIMHSQLTTPSGFSLMAADVPKSMGMEASPNGTIALSGDEVEELRGYFEKLTEGGQIAVPLEQAPWGDYFGQVTDRFGVSWMANIAGGGQPG
jgi:PhnB protein